MTGIAPKEKTNMKIMLYSDVGAKAYSVKVDYGKSLVIPTGWLNSVKNKKPGYKIEGWYLDEAFTKPYDLGTVIEKGTEDFAIYAKWIAE